MEAERDWAMEQFGGVELGDKRLTERTIGVAARMARRPGDSLPKQMKGWHEQKAAYRLLDHEGVSHAGLSRPHWEETRERAGTAGATVLMAQDITELDYSARNATEGLGPIGDHSRGRGLLALNTLAVSPEGRQVLGLAYQQVWKRDEENHKQTESRSERQKRENKQSARWIEAVNTIGHPPEGVRWVYVGDRESDIFDFFQAVDEVGAGFCVRIAQNCRLEAWAADDPHYLISDLRQFPAMGERLLDIPAKPGQKSRTAHLAVSWRQVTLRSPRNRPGLDTRLTLWAVRTWELDPPAGIEPLEWLLLTSVAVETLEDALERIEWYTHRWVVEEYHSCLKTGCAIEKSQLQHGDRLQRLLAFLSILAVRLLQLRDLSRLTPSLLAVNTLQPVLVQLMAAHTHTDPNTMTLRHFWLAVAQLGGFPARQSDGDPGWKRLWHGWLRLLDWAEGVRFAQNLPPLKDVGNP